MTTITVKKGNIHGKKLVLSRQEKINWERIYTDYIEIGYPKAIAEQYAWDFFWIDRKRKWGRK